MRCNLTITGLSDLRRGLRQLAASAPAAVAPALTDALKPIADHARDLAPEQTGRLRSAIDVVQQPSSAGICRSLVEVPLEYGAHQDLGFDRRKGDHFLEDAAAQGQAQAIEHATKQIISGLKL